jgi:hypothetical protein
MTASVLSPLAQPFHPIMGEEVQPTIYNNGFPSLTFSGTEHEFLRSITDETLDEAFPPSAEEAAELEAAEFFVALMAYLARLEEREEAARSLHEGLKKRWEVRRGLEGKPRAARHIVAPVNHGEPHLLDSHEITVVDHTPLHFENRMRAKEHMGKPRMNKYHRPQFGPKRPIHQPRKNS